LSENDLYKPENQSDIGKRSEIAANVSETTGMTENSHKLSCLNSLGSHNITSREEAIVNELMDAAEDRRKNRANKRLRNVKHLPRQIGPPGIKRKLIYLMTQLKHTMKRKLSKHLKPFTTLIWPAIAYQNKV